MVERSPFRRAQAGVALALLCVLVSVAPASVAAQDEAANEAEISAETVYFDTTGHYLSDEYGFLSYWRNHDGARMLGAPVTELLIENELVVQYFEKARLEAHVGVDDAPILLGHVGAEYARHMWVTFEPSHGPLGAEQSHFFETTGHTLHEPFLSFWRSVNGLDMLGYPISEPRWEYVGDRMLQVQYFERGRLEHHPDQMDEADRVQISNLGLALARLRGYDTAAIGPAAAPRSPDLPEHLRRAIGEAETETEAEADRAEETAQQAATRSAEPVAVRQGATPPQQTFFSSSPSAEEADWVVASQAITTTTRRVVVNLAHQRIYAMENGATVFDAPISTGMPGFETPEGNFFIYAKNPLQTMSGDLGGEYSVPNVPNSMYIHDDVAIHGTYWHNEFGTGVRRSHGCINLPLDAAARLYEWAAVGTPVTVTSATQ